MGQSLQSFEYAKVPECATAVSGDDQTVSASQPYKCENQNSKPAQVRTDDAVTIHAVHVSWSPTRSFNQEEEREKTEKKQVVPATQDGRHAGVYQERNETGVFRTQIR